MAKTSVYFDRVGNTVTVWFASPSKEYFCEEIGEDVIIMKDRRGRVIEFERLNYISGKQQMGLQLQFLFFGVANKSSD